MIVGIHRASIRRRLAGSGASAFVGAAAAILALGVFALGFIDQSLGDAPLFLLVMPIALASVAYGIGGGVLLGLFASGLAGVWWSRHGFAGGVAWLLSRSVSCVLVGGVLGWFADSRQGLVRQIAHHRELSLDLIATADYEGYFTQVNPAFTRTLGYMVEELLARPFLDFVHPDDREVTIRAAAEQTEAGLEVLNFQNRYRAKDGSYRWLEWASRPDPQAHELIAVARDITDRKLLEERDHRYQERLEQAVAERTRQLEEARQEIVQKLALAAEYRDDETRAHTGRVGEIAALIALELGLDQHVVDVIREAALLHDVGKVAVMDAVLLKPGKLTAAELDHVKQHAEIGAAILSGSTSEVLRVAEEIAHGHHEWWDGTGYPLAREGLEIPLTARVVAVADVFDAITHRRPYKAAQPIDDAVAEIRRLSGLQFDPAVVAAFERLDAHRLAGICNGDRSEPAGRRSDAGAATPRPRPPMPSHDAQHRLYLRS